MLSISPQALFIETDTQFVIYIIGWKAKHLARIKKGVSQEQVVQNDFVVGVEVCHQLLNQYYVSCVNQIVGSKIITASNNVNPATIHQTGCG